MKEFFCFGNFNELSECNSESQLSQRSMLFETQLSQSSLPTDSISQSSNAFSDQADSDFESAGEDFNASEKSRQDEDSKIDLGTKEKLT